MAQSASKDKPATRYIDAGIPDGPAVFVTGFGDRDSGWRNRTNSQPIEQTWSYDDSIRDVPVFRKRGANDEGS